MYERALPQPSMPDPVRPLVPAFAIAVAVVAALSDPGPAADVALGALPVAAFAAWAYLPGVPLWAVSAAVLAPIVVAERSGALEPLLFDASLLAFVIGRWAPSRLEAVALGVVCLLAPVLVGVIQDPVTISVGIWLLGTAFPWVVGRAAARQRQLVVELEATRQELADQALHAERRRIARDVHDFVGHGLAAVMLQITSARHVLRRDPAAADEALRSAEEVGRRSMRELRHTVGLLRSDGESGVEPPLASASEIAALVADARAGGLAVELQLRGDLSALAPGVGLALYRISQEALANAARHAPRAQTLLAVEVSEAWVDLLAETSGPVAPATASDPDRPRYGLIGMRERATALGGRLDARPTPEGWRLSCRIPLTEAVAAAAGDGRGA